jgi:RNA polymerase sigma-70 factor (ECF subfamily)
VRNDDAKAQEREKMAIVLGLIKSLGPESRRIIEMRNVEGLSYEQIRQALGIPLGTVMSRLSRARDQMRKLLESATAEAEALAEANG